MTDEQLLRYARHILLDEFGIDGQQALLASHALIVGAGGLGSPAAMFLAAAGVGTITIADHDTVDVSNLQRQILHTTASVNMPKVDSAKAAMHAINPEVKVHALNAKLDHQELNSLVENATIVLDCCDNFATRHAVNKACVAKSKPLVSGAAIRFSGQISVYDKRDKQAPCYNCLFPEGHDAVELRCATTGVLGPLVGIIGSMQAAEAIKLLSNMGTSLSGRLLCLDALSMEWSTIRFKRDPECAVCATA